MLPDASSSLTRRREFRSLGVEAEIEFEETTPRMEADIQIDACDIGE